jgi:hypothetical protein
LASGDGYTLRAMAWSADIEGCEHDWLAVDMAGHVGFFSSAGSGVAPRAYLDDLAAFEGAIEVLGAMPKITTATCNRDLPPGHVDTWRAMAERGLFAFDSDPLGGPYRIIATPHAPVLVTDLPADIGRLLSRVILLGVRFAEAVEIDEDLVP